MEKLRVLLADDHPLMIAGIRGALESQSDIEIVGEATSGAQVLPLIAAAKPNLVLLAPGPINRGVELTPEVADGPHSAILRQVTNGLAVRMAVLSLLCRQPSDL